MENKEVTFEQFCEITGAKKKYEELLLLKLESKPDFGPFAEILDFMIEKGLDVKLRDLLFDNSEFSPVICLFAKLLKSYKEQEWFECRRINFVVQDGLVCENRRLYGKKRKTKKQSTSTQDKFFEFIEEECNKSKTEKKKCDDLPPLID